MNVPDPVKKRLYEKAVLIHGKITKCASRQSLDDCYTVAGNHYVLWFNKPDDSTSIVREPRQDARQD